MRVAALFAALALMAAPAHAAQSDWIAADPQNTLVVETAKGRIFIELHPEVAPKAVERIKLLTERGSYDSLQFWRVVPNFVVQIDIGNVEGGKTELPNLAPEFSFRMKDGMNYSVAARPRGLEAGFMGALPIFTIEKNSTATPKAPDGSRSAWVTYCGGVAGMGRDAERDSANAELFFMTGAYPGLDRLFTPFGRIIYGQNLLDALPAGEPPAQPESLTSIRLLADIPDAPQLEVMNTQGGEFAARIEQTRKDRGADFSLCDVDVPARIVTKAVR